MKMNNLKLLYTALFCTIFSLCFIACDKGDKDDNISLIVGSWRCSNHYYWGPDTYTFNSNGTYYWSCPNYPSDSNDNGVYTYNKNSGLLTLSSADGVSKLYIVTFASSGTFLLTDDDGDSYNYRKTN